MSSTRTTTRTTYNVDCGHLGADVELASLRAAKAAANARAGRVAVYGPWEHERTEEIGDSVKVCERMLFWDSVAASRNDTGARARGEIQRITVRGR